MGLLIRGDNAEEEVLQAESHVLDIMYGFAESLVLRSVVELKIPDIIDSNGGPISLSGLASQLNLPLIDMGRLRRLMRYLVYMQIFYFVDSRYGLEPSVAPYLLSKGERTMAPIILSFLGEADDDYAANECTQTQIQMRHKTHFEKAMGMTFWEFLEKDPEKSKIFNATMAARFQMSSFVRCCKGMFESITSLVDVGGLNGATLDAISKAFPHIKCTVFDLPHAITTSSLDYPKLKRIPGDMFKSVPGAQAVLLKEILHEWSDEDCTAILRRCKEAVVNEEGGRVIIFDVVLVLSDETTDDGLNKVRMASDMDMMVTTGGKERTEKEWKKLIYGAGYREYKITHIDALRSVIEAFP
ncbi:hypothetical protein QJS10_CPB18g00724 [Acorus calamus]|uniref:Uncharacterized protein n=1 Tax=Acorus calamus TaxID=4465 RepID=A0AAV9CKR8_ACOCL|nr:hypothetical protein QJS10_CPB18g00724 [Acorus calamus]